MHKVVIGGDSLIQRPSPKKKASPQKTLATQKENIKKVPPPQPSKIAKSSSPVHSKAITQAQAASNITLPSISPAQLRPKKTLTWNFVPDPSLHLDQIFRLMPPRLSGELFTVALKRRPWKAAFYLKFLKLVSIEETRDFVARNVPREILFIGSDLGVFTPSQVVRQNIEEYQMVLPELEFCDPDYFEIVKSDIDEILLNHWMKDNWAMLRKFRISLKEAFEVVKNDDIETLKEMASSPSFRVDETMAMNGYTISLISYAAFCSSIQCFKFLLLNGAKTTSPFNDPLQFRTMQWAVAGGNEEIISMLEQNNETIDKCLDTAFLYHQNHIAEWLIDAREILVTVNIAGYIGENIEALLILKDRDLLVDTMGVYIFNDSFIIDPVAEYAIENCNLSAIDNMRFATTNSSFALAKALIEKGIRFDMMSAVLSPDPIFVYLFAENGANPNIAPDDTPLGDACNSNNFEVVQALIEIGANPNKAGLFGPPLVRCQIPDGRQITKYLVQNGANPNANGHLKKWLNYPVMLLWLIEHGANPDEPGLMTIAAQSSQSFALLQRHGGFIDEKDEDGQTALAIAAEDGDIERVRFLLINGANVNTVNLHGSTPLHLAASEGHLLIVQMLLHYGAAVNINDLFGVSPIAAAVRNGHMEIARTLLQNGATPQTNYSAVSMQSIIQKQREVRALTVLRTPKLQKKHKPTRPKYRP